MASKEKIYTIPLNDAMNENDECIFCFLERKLLYKTMDFVLGDSSSYMESDIREIVDAVLEKGDLSLREADLDQCCGRLLWAIRQLS